MCSIRSIAVALAAGALCAHPGLARAITSYSVTLQGASETSSTPLRRSFWTATPGVAPTIIYEQAAASAGEVGASTRLSTSWPFEIQTGVQGDATARAATDDFVITGPADATTVEGAMLFHTRIRLDRSGGLAGSDFHRANAVVRLAAAQMQTVGSCWFGNMDQGSDGVLAGGSPPLLDEWISVPGTFPVGVPFSVSMEFDAAARTYGDSTVSPGSTEADGVDLGIALGDANGHVMQLPPGYTVNAPDWQVVANVTSVGTRGVDAGVAGLTAAAPNPSAGRSAFELSLPRAGEVELVVSDLAGRLMRRLVSGWMSAGLHEESWDGRGDTGERVAPGVYFASLRYGNRTLVRRVARIR